MNINILQVEINNWFRHSGKETNIFVKINETSLNVNSVNYWWFIICLVKISQRYVKHLYATTIHRFVNIDINIYILYTLFRIKSFGVSIAMIFTTTIIDKLNSQIVKNYL